MPMTKNGFKEAFLKRKDKMDTMLNEFRNEFEEVTDLIDRQVRGLQPELAKALDVLYDEIDKIYAKVEDEDITSKSDYKDALKELKAKEKEAKELLARGKAVLDTYRFKIEDDDLPKGLQLNPISIPGYAEKTKKEQQQIQTQMVAKLKDGKALCDRLMDDDFDPQDGPAPTQKEVSALMWYLRAMSEKYLNEPWAKGAMSIPDPDNKIRKYLDRCQKIYVRKSTHLEEQAKDYDEKNVTGGKSARGIDFYEGSADLDKLLPYGMNTLLMQTVETDGGNNQMLYLKMETESAFGTGGDKDRAKDTDEDERDLPQTERGKEGGDTVRTIKHGLNVFKKKEKIAGMSDFREQTPREDVETYEALLDDIDDEEAKRILKSRYRKQTKRDKMSGVFGNQIRINDMLALYDEIIAKEGTDDITQEAIDRIKKERKALLKKYPDAEFRFGSEVAIPKDFLVNA